MQLNPLFLRQCHFRPTVQVAETTSANAQFYAMPFGHSVKLLARCAQYTDNDKWDLLKNKTLWDY